ncbi:MAG: hypothetical protein SOR91_09835 [Hornefia butyriciproducens]|uniref:hypothetical protein n=1 Tax=Hornefia TaxID=2815774 RepID=UPI00130153EC|nr:MULTISPECIES: hypothetical protein [Hornefia]MDY2991755.1 hypothetical protein [Hornefia butyriciproducens]MDY5463204.1 hypothetical protein [Hornefia butyriciproducens]
MTKKIFRFHGRRYRWSMTNWQAILLVAAEVAICAWSFAVLVYLGIMIDAIF